MNKKHLKRLRKKILRQRLGINQLRIRILRKIRNRIYYKLQPDPWPSFLCEDVIGIRPMDGPMGTVFYLNIMK